VIVAVASRDVCGRRDVERRSVVRPCWLAAIARGHLRLLSTPHPCSSKAAPNDAIENGED
jgi:hypothetical protein